MPFGNAISTASYNAYTFSAHMETVSVDSRAGYDEAGRTVTRMIYVIRLRDRVYDAEDTGDAIENIRRRLSVPGKTFTYTNHGLGDFAINSAEVRDTDWGPKPRVISWSPVGGTRAWEFVWEVEVSIPECDQATSQFAIMEFNYQLATDLDISGYTTRTYTGHLIIPQTRVSGGRNLQDTADNYWHRIQPKMPVSFQRVRRDRVLDKSKSRLDFVIVDEEVGPNFFPVGVIDCRASHSLRSDHKAFVKWVGTIKAEYELDRAYPRSTAYGHFAELVRRRMQKSRQEFVHLPSGSEFGTESLQTFILPCSFQMQENDLYGRAVSSFEFHYIMLQPLSNILKASALWTPLGNDYYKWSGSLNNRSQNPRGNARLKFNPADDAIVDLCLSKTEIQYAQPETPLSASGSVGTSGTGTLGGADTDTGQSDDSGTGVTEPGANPFGCPMPNLKESWLHYEMSIRASSTSYVMEHKPLPTNNDKYADPPSSTVNPSYVVKKGQDTPPSQIQYLNSNDNYITLVGTAFRCLYDIPRPRLMKIGNKDVVEANREGVEFFETKIVNSFLMPVVVATFRLRWLVKNANGPLGTIVAPETPMLRRAGNISPNGQLITDLK